MTKVNPWQPASRFIQLTGFPVYDKRRKRKPKPKAYQIWRNEAGKLVAKHVGYKGVFQLFEIDPGGDGAPRYRVIPHWSKRGYIFDGPNGARIKDLVDRGEL